MAQVAEIVLAILGLCNVVSLPAVCWTVLGCEFIRFLIDLYEKYN